jgi:hypothetical protein
MKKLVCIAIIIGSATLAGCQKTCECTETITEVEYHWRTNAEGETVYKAETVLNGSEQFFDKAADCADLTRTRTETHDSTATSPVKRQRDSKITCK